MSPTLLEWEPSYSRPFLRVVPVCRAVHTMCLDGLIIGQIQVTHEDLYAGVPHEFLQGADICSIAQHAHGKGVAEPVRVHANASAL